MKSYDDFSDTDEFFLVQYPAESIPSATDLSRSVPTVTDACDIIPQGGVKRYRRCLQEYYNDYEDCLEAYKTYSGQKPEEMNDDDIFNEIILPFKSQSAPDVLDSEFLMLTYDPGPDKCRRKSAFVPGYQCDHDR